MAKNALKTGVTEAVMGFAADVGRQIIVDEKDIKEVDLGQAAKTAAVAGISGAVGYTIREGITTNGNSAGLTKPLNTTTDGNRLKMNLQYFAEGAEEAAGSVTGRTADIGSVKGAKIYI